MIEEWTCVCGNRNKGNFCTECGIEKGAVWSELHFTQNHMSNAGGCAFTVAPDAYSNLLLSGNCFDKKGHLITETKGFFLRGDILEELRGMELDKLPERKNLPPELCPLDKTAYCLSLKYPNGVSFAKDTPQEIQNKIFSLLENELCKKDAAEKKRAKEFAAPDYEIFAAIRENDLGKVRKLVTAAPSLVNAVAPKRPLDTRGMSPLQVSLCTGWHRDIAWFLLENGADVNYCAAKEVCSDFYPVLFDGVNTAIWNARRYAWNGRKTMPMQLEWKHTREEADDAFAFLKRMLELGADVTQTNYVSCNCLMEAVSEANHLCPHIDIKTGKPYPGHPITPEMQEDLRRIFQLLIDAGADRNNISSFSKMSIRQHYESEPVWQICGDLFDNAQ